MEKKYKTRLGVDRVNSLWKGAFYSSYLDPEYSPSWLLRFLGVTYFCVNFDKVGTKLIVCIPKLSEKQHILTFYLLYLKVLQINTCIV